MGARLEMGKPPRSGARRTLLAGIALPIPPTINDYWKQSKPVFSRRLGQWISTVYLSAEAKEYKRLLRDLMLERKAWYYSEEPLHLRMLFCFADNRANDVDNRVKPLQDALAFAGVYKNDKQVKILEAREGPPMKPATCFVWLDEFVPDRQGNLRWIQNPVGCA